MRQHSLLTLCVSILLLMGAVSCTGTNKRSDYASTAQAVALPELAEGQLVEFEDDTLRIVDATPEALIKPSFLSNLNGQALPLSKSKGHGHFWLLKQRHLVIFC
ncbi:hypothetical protein [Porphyromonas cangingivalis]|uniref:hypothetical protein n=1 Tax=Porphyromonas cangingivalis TaxID=36874 RepID=UPI00046F9CCD|nr:hypothetical protein [Porphyromonas cangingivalis]